MKKYYVKHERLYLLAYFPDLVSEWSNELPENHFETSIDAWRMARKIRNGPRQFGGLGSKSRVVSRRVK